MPSVKLVILCNFITSKAIGSNFTHNADYVLKSDGSYKTGNINVQKLQLINTLTDSKTAKIVNVTMALSRVVSEIFNVEKYQDLEIQVRGHSRSSKLVPFDRQCVVSY